MISFDSLDYIPEKYFSNESLIDWLVRCAKHYGHGISRLAYRFCDEAEMLHYNQEYLDHDFFTDILTFPESRKTNPIKGDVLINIDRLRDNAIRYGEPEEKELLRLLAHGLLHLCGFNDLTDADKEEMTGEENRCIAFFK